MGTPRPDSRRSRDRIARRAIYSAYMNSKAWQNKRREWYARWLTLIGSRSHPVWANLGAIAGDAYPNWQLLTQVNTSAS